MTKEEQLAKLLADGYLLEDLTWIGPRDPVCMQLLHGSWENPSEVARQEMERHKHGQWVIKVAAVERRIRESTNNPSYSIKSTRWPSWMQSFLVMRAP